MLTLQPVKKINIATVGLDEAGKSRIEIIFKTQFKGQCQLSALASADVVLIDIESKNATELESVKKLVLQHESLPHIYLGDKLKEDSQAVSIAKPPKIKALWDNILELSQRSQNTKRTTSRKSAPGETVNKTKANSAAPARTHIELSEDHLQAHFDMNDYLLGSLLSVTKAASENSSAVHISCWDDRQIILYPRSGNVLSDLKTSQLKNLGLIQVVKSTAVTIKNLDESALSELAKRDTKEVWAQSLETFLWNLALRTSRGRLPLGTSTDQTYTLTRWPNFTRLDQFPENMRIAAYWTQNPASLTQIAKQLGIKERYVWLFFTAASAIDIVSTANSANQSQQSSGAHDKRSLLKDLLGHLSFKKNSPENA